MLCILISQHISARYIATQLCDGSVQDFSYNEDIQRLSKDILLQATRGLNYLHGCNIVRKVSS